MQESLTASPSAIRRARLNRHGFKEWLDQRGLKENTVATYLSDAKGVEKHFGDLDQLYKTHGLADTEIGDLFAEIAGLTAKSRSSYWTAVRRYRDYREQTDPDPVPPDVDDGRARIMGLERDLQAALRDCIEQLEAGLQVTDGGDERSVASGFIDITAKDRDGKAVVIELKAGTARRDAIGQVLSYMGDVADEESAEVRGILVAGEFDDKARAAARVVPGLSLRRYRVKFEFSPPRDAAPGGAR